MIEKYRDIDNLNAQIRKKQNLLITSGYAVMMFGIWSIVRAILMFVLEPDVIWQDAGISIDDLQGIEIVIFWITILVVLLCDLLLRMYVGKRAVREGLGKRQKSIYIVLCAISVIFTISADVSAIINLTGDETIEMLFSYVVVDVSTCISMVLVVTSALSLRRLNRNKESIKE